MMTWTDHETGQDARGYTRRDAYLPYVNTRRRADKIGGGGRETIVMGSEIYRDSLVWPR